MTLSCILQKIFSEKLYFTLRQSYLEIYFDESDDILNNEICIWISTLESLYPIIPKKIMFIKPDYNETEFHSIAYRFESSKITIQEIGESLSSDFKIEK